MAEGLGPEPGIIHRVIGKSRYLPSGSHIADKHPFPKNPVSYTLGLLVTHAVNDLDPGADACKFRTLPVHRSLDLP